MQHLKSGKSRKFEMNFATGNVSATCFVDASMCPVETRSKLTMLKTVVSTVFMHHISIITKISYNYHVQAMLLDQ